MMRFRYSLPCMPLLGASALIGFASSLAGAQTKPLAEIPFEWVGGRIYMATRVNGQPVSAILDSGAASTIMDLSLANRLGLATSGELNAQGGGSEVIKGKFLKGAKVDELDEPVPFAIPISSLDRIEGRHLETVVGYHFLKTHVVEIDYAKRRLRVFGPDQGFSPIGKELSLKVEGGLCHVQCQMQVNGTLYDMEALVDTGASGSALSTRFIDAHPLKVSATPVMDLGAGVGGTSRGRMFRPSSVRLLNWSLKEPVVALTETGGGVVGKKASFDLLLGADILQRFVVTFDYPHHRLFLSPNPSLAKPFQADKTGLRIFAEGDDLRTFRVVGVLEGSSAAKAGVLSGDEIATVNGVPAKQWSLSDLRETFHSPEAKSWKLGLVRDGKSLTVTVPSKSII